MEFNPPVRIRDFICRKCRIGTAVLYKSRLSGGPPQYSHKPRALIATFRKCTKCRPDLLFAEWRVFKSFGTYLATQRACSEVSLYVRKYLPLVILVERKFVPGTVMQTMHSTSL